MTDDTMTLGRRAPEQRRTAVLEAARSLFLAGGVAGTSIDAIARRAGVAKGTVYLYFPAKEHIVRAIEADFTARILDRTRAAARSASGDVSGVVQAWCVALVLSYLDDLDIHDMLFYGGAPATREGVADNALVDDLHALLAALEVPDPAATAAFLVGGVTMLTDRAILADRAASPAELLRSVRRLAAGVSCVRVTGEDGGMLLPPLDPRPDIRLVAVDMDGTLLDAQGRVPEDLWPLLERMAERGIAFAPASGRQYATLRREFGEHGDEMVFIAENGTFVVRHDAELSSDVIDPAVVAEVVATVRALMHDVGIVLCGKRSAYIERTDEAFRTEADRYYAELRAVDDLDAVTDDILKIAVFDFGSAEHGTAPALAGIARTHQVVVSGEHWVDVMNPGANKGVAVRRLQEVLGVTAEQTVVFGDYLNDLEMMDAAVYSFAMANAHPDVAARARYRAPSNAEHGVIRVLEALLA